jgi:hypothetical protein
MVFCTSTSQYWLRAVGRANIRIQLFAPQLIRTVKAVAQRRRKVGLDPNVEQHLNALASFKDWSNYMLVTTVAALGWVASTAHPAISPYCVRWVVVCLDGSTLFAVFTLALIPIVAEGITKDTKSFYDVTANFDLIFTVGPRIGLKLKWVCWWQHLLFLVGIAIYTVAHVRA